MIKMKCKKYRFDILEENKSLFNQLRRSGKKYLLLNIRNPDEGIRELCKMRLKLPFSEVRKIWELKTQKLSAIFDINLESELSKQLTEEIQRELDNEILLKLKGND